MPKKLNASSNERIDLDDFTRASSSYTKESDAFNRDKLWLARRAAVSGGFRIELSNQATNPGEFTIYNGVAIDRAGCILNNEDQANDARTLTLSGANTDFYIEVEFVESVSDVDSRAFWDPSFTGNDPPGKEFFLNASTRVSPDWQPVTPISTTAFDESTDPNSLKIPVAFLQTNGSNEITGITLVNAATIVEEDVVATATKLPVLDSTIFPDSGTASIVVGNSVVESITFTANDRTNGILTLSPALVGSFSAGAIVRETGVTAGFIPEATAAVPSTASDSDLRRVLLKGDAYRGSAITASKEDSDNRDDLDIRSLKDYVDFLAAQLRELKWGNLRPDINSSLPPSDFTNTDYLHNAGSVQGARESVITIGDGTVSFGDLNSTSDDLGTVIQQAHDALDATNGGSVYVKAGNYVYDATVTVDRTFKLEFDKGAVFVAGVYATYAIFPGANVTMEIVGLPEGPTTNDLLGIADFTGFEVKLTLKDCTVGYLSLTLGGAGTKIIADNCDFLDTGFDALQMGVTRRDELSVFRSCRFLYVDEAGDSTRQLVSNCSDTTFEDCIFDISHTAAFSVAKFVNQNMTSIAPGRMTFDRCSFLSTNTGKAVNPFDFTSSTFFPGIDGITFRDCKFDFTFGTTNNARERTVLEFAIPGASSDTLANVLVQNCDFSAIDQNNTIGAATLADPYRAISVISQAPVYNVVIDNCKFGKDVNPSGGTSTLPNHFTEFVYLEVTSPEGSGVTISNNSFSTFTRAVNVSDNGSFKIVGNYFRQKAQTAPFGTIIYAVYINGGQNQALLANNHIEMLTFEAGATDHTYGIFVAEATNVSIVDNDINVLDFFLAATTAAVRAIYFATSVDPTEIVIANNHATVVTAEKQAAAIFVSVVSGTVSAVNISDNFVEAVSLSVSLNNVLQGIFLSNDSTTAQASPAVVSGNTVKFDDTGSAVTSIVRGISLVGDKISAVSNSVAMHDVGSTNVVGIYGSNCEYCTISNNAISIQDTNAALYGIRGILLSSDCSYTTVSGNTIYGEEDMRWCIELDGGASSEMRGVAVSNNVMDAACIDAVSPHGGIHFTTTNVTVGDCGAWSIVGNSFFERRTNAGDSDRHHIRVEGTLQVTGVSIVGNSNSDSFNAANRAAADILVNTVTRLNVQGNICDRSATTSGSIRIDIDNCQSVLVEGNVIPYSAGIGATGRTLAITNSTAGLFDNNIGIGVTIVPAALLTGSANIISGGSNHFDPGVLS